jgi:asparagine synthase (glutamine-hydrolysing)
VCGIAGFCDTNLAGPRVDDNRRAVLRSMMDSIRHRGPDGDGEYLDDHCGLGHLRLKIIDLSDNARQPMATADGLVLITFNGEIYNFRELRVNLERHYQFRSTSDTEVLLYGYRHWGADVFSRANGMFAAALWEPTEQRLVLARDRIGKKPLFYYWNGGEVVFGSELKALLRHPRVVRELDEDSLAHYLTFAYIPTPRTIFKHVYKVPQGATVTFHRGERVTAPFWELPEDELVIDEHEALDELDRLLRDAVRVRLESDVPLGFFLSGGIDSSLITAIGKQLAGDIRTFTIGFNEVAYDESNDAKRIAAHLGTRHTQLRINHHDFSHFLDSAPKYYDEPFADSSLIATYFLARATKQHVTVTLSGDGGDELFCGYQKYLNLWQLMPAMHLPAPLRAAAGRLLEEIPNNTTRKLGHALQSGSTDELIRWLVSVWKADELAKLLPNTALQWEGTELARTLRRFATRDRLTGLMAADIRSYLCDDILQKVDRASMAVALEVRCPLLDYRVVEFAMRLPLDLKFRWGQRKYLLRKLLARYLPPELWAGHSKHGLSVPVKQWYRAQRRQPMLDSIRELGNTFPGLLSTSTMSHFMSEHLTGKYDYSQKLFALDSLHEWAREYL